MQLRWTREAAADLERIADYLIQHLPERAAELVRAVYDAPALLLEFPHRGRPGTKAGTRDLTASDFPFGLGRGSVRNAFKARNTFLRACCSPLGYT